MIEVLPRSGELMQSVLKSSMVSLGKVPMLMRAAIFREYHRAILSCFCLVGNARERTAPQWQDFWHSHLSLQAVQYQQCSIFSII